MLTREDLERAVAVLNRSHTGRFVMERLLTMLNDGGMSLDHQGQRAVMNLLVAAWTDFPGTARDLMREALEA